MKYQQLKLSVYTHVCKNIKLLRSKFHIDGVSISLSLKLLVLKEQTPLHLVHDKIYKLL